MKNLSQFHTTLKQAKNLADVNQALESILKDYGITMYTYTCYTTRQNSQKRIKYDSCSAAYLPWHQHYLAEDYDIIDSTQTEVFSNNLPVFWDLSQQLAEARTQREKQMRLDSIEFGVEKGVSIPIHSGASSNANFLLAQKKGESCLEKREELQYDFFVIAHYYHQFIQKFLVESVDTEEYNLSKRELQCLLLTSKKLDVKSIANKLNISERTVNFHLQNINKKFGARNKHHSVMLAIEKGIIV